MLHCVECGSELNAEDLQQERIECEHCGIEHELVGKTLIGLQLGPQEE
jgi:hypothetical protein